MMRSLYKDNSDEIAFVVAALFAQAINTEELRKWADSVLASDDEFPPYIAELAQFDGKLKDIYELIGFVPSLELSDDEIAALHGIGYLRNRVTYPDDIPSESEVRMALSRRQHVKAEFQRVFPFLIDFSHT